MSSSLLLTHYRDLEPGLKTMVQILAIHSIAFRLEHLVTCLDTLGIRDDQDRPFTSHTLMPCMKKLETWRLIKKSAKGIACACEIRSEAVIDTVLSKRFKPMARAVLARISFPHGCLEIYSGKQEVFYRAFQLAVFNDEQEMNLDHLWQLGWNYYAEMMYQHSPFMIYFNRPFCPEVFTTFLKRTRARVVSFSLASADRTLEPAQDLFDAAQDLFIDYAGDTDASVKVLESFFLKGELAKHGLILETIQKADPVNYSLHKGLRHLVFDENHGALDMFNKGLALYKKAVRKRKIFLDGLPGIFFLMALLKSEDPDAYQQGIDHIDGALRTPDMYERLFTEMNGLFSERLGQEDMFGLIELLDSNVISGPNPHSLILSFFHILILTWKNKELGKSQLPLLKEIQEKSNLADYAWLNAEASALLALLGINKKKNLQTAKTLHKKLGTTSLVHIVKHIPGWEKKLKALEGLGLSPGKNSLSCQTGYDQRLVWMLDYNEELKTVGILPRLQKLTKTKQWTKGRAVALKTLYQGFRAMDWLTDQDRQACAAIEKNAYQDGYYGYGYAQIEYELDVDTALSALADHPLLYEGGDLTTPVELTQKAPEMRLRKTQKGLSLTLVPTLAYEDQKCVVTRENPARFSVTTFTGKHEQIHNIIGEKGLLVPATGEPIADKALTSISSLIQVNSDLAITGSSDAQQIDADAVPKILISPWQEGLCIDFRVRPFTDTGSYFKPGRGGSHVFAEVDGKHVQAHREFDLELCLADAVTAQCPSLLELEPVDGQYQAGDPEQALELLLELKNSSADKHLEWPRGETFKIGHQASFNRLNLGIKKDREWFKATGTLTIDEDLSLDLKKLLSLLETATGRFIPLDDGSFISLTQSFKDQLEDLRSFSVPHGKGIRFTPLASPAIEQITEQAGSLKTDKAWKAHCTRLSQTIDPQVPNTLQAELRDYQITGFKWLAQLVQWQVGACLADDMGLGKTLQALSVLLLNAGKGPCLVVAPLSVIANWQDECRRFAPTLNARLFGPGDRQLFLDGLGGFDLVISSYGLLQSEQDKLAGVHWQAVVLDEAQAIKNMKSKRSRAAMELRADFRLITTGTPVENHLDELWTLFNFINPGLLGTFNRFKETFVLPIERDKDKAASRRLKKLISPFILRRLKTDVLKELPEKIQVTLHVEMNEDERMLYEAQRLRAIENIEAADEAGPGQKHFKILAELTRLRQLCCNPGLLFPEAGIKSSKLEVFSDTVDELLVNRHKALVFSQFVRHLGILRQLLDKKGITYQYLDGSTPAKERARRINAFQSGQGEIFLISLKAGGTGLNLTAADYVIHMDPWWNPAVEDQASDRAHRIGQTRPVTVYRLVVKDTIEERIMALHEEKRDLAQNLLTGSDMAGKISAGQLLELIRRVD